MRSILIEWKHFDQQGKTCTRCSATGNNLAQATAELRGELAVQEIEIVLEETKLPEERMAESNEILVDGIRLEELLPDARAAMNACSSCGDLIGGKECCCRTINRREEVFEEIPVGLIKEAIWSRIKSKKPVIFKIKHMKIEVLGSGCPSCHKLFELTKKAVEEMGLKTEVEYITDIQKILEMGVMSVPVLAVDGKAVISGSVPGIERIKEALGAHAANQGAKSAMPCCSDKNACDTDCQPNKNGVSGCSCGGNC